VPFVILLILSSALIASKKHKKKHHISPAENETKVEESNHATQPNHTNSTEPTNSSNSSEIHNTTTENQTEVHNSTTETNGTSSEISNSNFEKPGSNGSNYETPVIKSPEEVSTTPKLVSDLLANYPGMKDRHGLWKDFSDMNYQKVRYNGVHGNVWAAPLGHPQSDNGFTHIASPHANAAAAKVDRIIASDLAASTWSGSSFDLPPRKNVLQIDIPSSTTSTTTYGYNASLGHAPNLRKSTHGRFMQTEFSPLVQKSTQDALAQAKQVEATAAALTGQVVSDPTSLVIPIQVKNKKDSTSLSIPLK